MAKSKEMLELPSGINRNSCYTTNDLCVILGISNQTARKLIHSNQFKSYRIGSYLRVDKAGFDAWLEKQKKED